MSFTYVGQSVTSVNGMASGSTFTLPSGTASGDLLTIAVYTTGDFLPTLPGGWTTRYAVNKNAAGSLISNIVRGYIIRGGSAPGNTLNGWTGLPHVTVVVKAYRPSGAASFVSELSVDSSAVFGISHSWAGIAGLQTDDVLDFALSSGRSQSFGNVSAATDPSTASGAVVTMGMPSAGAWHTREKASAPVAQLTWFSADGVKSSTGATGNISITTDSNGGPLGSVLVFRDAAAAPIITGPSGAAGAASININVAENSTALGTWTATSGATWSISGGADATQVQISAGGVVTFLAPNDFENPDDVGANRVYNFTVQNVGAGGTSTQDVAATLTNVTELPGAPTIGVATAGNATVTVPFTPPSAGTAPSVIDFTVTLSPGGATKTVSASPAVFTSADGVVNGTAYTGTVTARNSDGSGAASAASNSVTPSFNGPVLSSPTKDTPTATTATLGFSTTGVDGTARAVLVQSATVPTSPNIAQVKAGQNAAGNSSGVVVPSALTITSAGSKNFAAATVTTGLSYYGFVVHTDAAGNDSDVLSLGVLYPGTARPVSDITTTGWTGSAGGPLALLLDEDTDDDADFVTSPALSSTPTGLTMAMSKAYGAGTYTGVKAKLWCSTGTCVARIRFLDSGGAVVGTTADITVTTTPTLFTVSATLTGTAVRWTLEGAV